MYAKEKKFNYFPYNKVGKKTAKFNTKKKDRVIRLIVSPIY